MTTLDVSPLDSDYEPSEPSGICSDIDCGHNEDAATVPEQTPQPLPEGGYGWVCVASGFLINAHTWGVNSAYGVLLAFYLSDDTFPGTTALEYAFVGGLSIAAALAISPVPTFMIHHGGRRVVLCIGTILVAISLIATSFASKTWQLFLSQGLCFGLGMGFAFVGSVGVVSHWFHARRSFVNGIVSAGSGIGGLIYSLAVNAMIESLNYPWAMRVLGIVCCIVNLVCGNLLRMPPGSHDHHAEKRNRRSPFNISLLRQPEYLLYLTWGVLSALGYIALLFSLSSYAVAVGLTQHQGSIASALLNLGQGLGRPIVGLLSDPLGRIRVPFVATVIAGILCLALWPFAKSAAVVYFFAIAVGLESGALWAAAAPIAAEIVGLPDLEGALGFFWVILAPPTAVSEAIALQLRDSTSNRYPYLRVQLFAGFMYLGAGAALVVLGMWRVKKK